MDDNLALYRQPMAGGPAQRLGTLSPQLGIVRNRLTNDRMAAAPDDSKLLHSRVGHQEIDCN
jgi:hypothetical protein